MKWCWNWGSLTELEETLTRFSTEPRFVFFLFLNNPLQREFAADDFHQAFDFSLCCASEHCNTAELNSQGFHTLCRIKLCRTWTWCDTCDSGAAGLDAAVENSRKGKTHLLAWMVSTEPAEGLPVDTWPPSLSPSCSQMSLKSPKLQVLSSASLSGLHQTLRKKEGKLVQGKKKRGGGQDAKQDTI